MVPRRRAFLLLTLPTLLAGCATFSIARNQAENVLASVANFWLDLSGA